MSIRDILVHVGFSSTESINANNSLDPHGYTPIKTFGANTVTFEITNTMLTNANGVPPAGKYFDFTVRFSNGTVDGAQDTDGNSSVDTGGGSTDESADDIFVVNFNCNSADRPIAVSPIYNMIERIPRLHQLVILPVIIPNSIQRVLNIL
jgi:hypothetical protein